MMFKLDRGVVKYIKVVGAFVGLMMVIFWVVSTMLHNASDALLNVHHELFCSRNVGFSQPYYSPQPIHPSQT